MKEKVLILASVASMIDQFNIPNIKLLQSMGYEVHVACNFEKGNSCSFDKIQMLKELLNKLNVKYFQINFERNILKLGNNLKAYKEVKKLLIENKYKFLHCHSPIGGVVGRIAGYKTQTKVIYTAHGFHFFKGAPLINWLLYYPIEKYLSKYTDILITINQEDYKKAQTFYAKKVKYIPGVGIDTEKIKNIVVDKKKKREGLGLAALESMCSGLPLIYSNIHGIKDYSVDKKTGYCIDNFDINKFEKAIEKLTYDRELRQKMGNYNKKMAEKFDIRNIEEKMKKIYIGVADAFI